MRSEECNLLGYDAVQSVESLLATRVTTRIYIPEDSTLHNHRCEYLKLCIPMIYSALKQPYSFFTKFFYLLTGTLMCVVYNDKCCFMENFKNYLPS
jgi:hypothetical protein